MSRFEREWALVPTAARVIAALAALGLVALMALIWLREPMIEGNAPHAIRWLWFFVTSIIPGAFIAGYILLVGYVWGDAKRRRMNAVLWVLLAIFIPNAIGVILYFILRDPLPVPCPSCQAPVDKELACCSSCGTMVRPACPECRRPTKNGWTHCGYCGAVLRPANNAATP